ncbi:MAG: hypothetical protein EA421_17715 [Gemmatimonadales bacterium]|nr:MAG: hypothetical protein EA421_17715 [Gemmatimonadales bacterium]
MSAPLARPTRDELLADTEETLRAVARALGTVDAGGAPAVPSREPLTPIGSLARFLAESYGELARIMEGLRETRGLFRQAEVEQLKTTHMALQEVTSQTEMATTDMLDGLERSLELVDRIAESGPVDGGEEVSTLRDELHLVIQHLQFQDITSQRIGHATQVLSEVEHRFLALMRTLESYGFGPAVEASPEEREAADADAPVTCDPMATTQDAETRQALADELFA